MALRSERKFRNKTEIPAESFKRENKVPKAGKCIAKYTEYGYNSSKTSGYPKTFGTDKEVSSYEQRPAAAAGELP